MPWPGTEAQVGRAPASTPLCSAPGGVDPTMATAPQTTFVRLLDADPALAAGLSDEALALAQAVLLAPVEPLDVGSWQPVVPERPEQHLGFLVLEGVLFRRVAFAERESAELLGPGDLLRPWQGLRTGSGFATPASWNVVEAGAIAVLDERVSATIGRWPQIVVATVGRALERSREMAVTLGIAQMTGVELRLLAMLWHLAERFGHRDGDCWVVPIHLTHQMLAALVRTGRTTVTRALSGLVRQDLVARAHDGRWLLRGEPPEGLNAMRRALDG